MTTIDKPKTLKKALIYGTKTANLPLVKWVFSETDDVPENVNECLDLALKFQKEGKNDTMSDIIYEMIDKIVGDIVENTNVDENDFYLDLDAPEWISFKDGIYNLKFGTFLKKKNQKMTLNLEYLDLNHNVDGSKMEKFVESLMPNKEWAIYLKTVIGYCMTELKKENKFFVFYGPGSNGKTTFLRILEEIMGDYIYRAGSGELITTLNKKRVVYMQDRGTFSEGAIRKYLESNGDYGYVPSQRHKSEYVNIEFKMIFVTNEMPVIKDDDLKKAMVVIPFTNTFTIDSQAVRVINIENKILEDKSDVWKWINDGIFDYQMCDGLKEVPKI